MTFADGSTPSAAEGSIGLLEYTTDAPASINGDPDTNTSTWCAESAFGAGGCPAGFASVTGIRFSSNFNLDVDGTPRQGQKMNLILQAADNKPGDVYTNRASVDTASFPASQYLRSNNVSVQIASYALGDFIFADLNANGLYEQAIDYAVSDSVTVNLRKSADDSLIATTDTSVLGNGLFSFSELRSGDYYLEIPAAEFAATGSLPGWTVSTNPVDPDADANEDIDQSGYTTGSEAVDGVRTADLTLSGNPPPPGGVPTGAEPTGDNVHGIILTATDDFANLTVDIGLVPADSDSDCIPDIVEWQGQPIENAPDLDKDGTPDYLDTDADGDGIDDKDEVSDCDFSTPPDDDDNDGIPDYLDFARVGLAKSVKNVMANADGSFNVGYSLLIDNLGTEVLHDMQLTDSLIDTFGALQVALPDVDVAGEYIITRVPTIVINAAVAFTANTAFTGDGADIELLDVMAGGALAVGESMTVEFELRFYPDLNKTPYNNQALVEADANDNDTKDAGILVSDLSDDGTDTDADDDGNPSESGEDDPTPLMIPSIGIAKRLINVAEISANVFDVGFEFLVENLSSVEPASYIQVEDDLATTFSSADSFDVQSLTTATLSKNPAYNGNSDIKLLTGGDNLAPNSSERIQLVVRVNTGGDTGPYSNQVTMTTADTLGGTVTASDLSDDGARTDENSDGSAGGPNENDPTVFQLPPQEVAVTKSVVEVRQSGPTTYEIDYQLILANTSQAEAATNVQIKEDLSAAFPGVASIQIINAPSVSAPLTAVDASFDGLTQQNILKGDEQLAVGERAEILFTVAVNIGSVKGPFYNTVVASTANQPDGDPIMTDQSDSGSDPFGDNPAAPGDTGTSDDPTPVAFNSQSIAIAKHLSSVVEVSNGVFDVQFDFQISNPSSDIVATNVQVLEDLSAAFAGTSSVVVQSLDTGSLTANANFNVAGDHRLLAGSDTLAVSSSEIIKLLVRVDTAANKGPFSNQVVATTSATNGGDYLVQDLSDDGTNPDANANGHGGDNGEDDPTVFQLPPQQVTIAKQVTAVSQIDMASYLVAYRLVVSNPSTDQAATNVQIIDDLALAFPGVASINIAKAPTISGGLAAINAAYDGQADINLLSGSESLAIGATAIIDFELRVDLGAQAGPFLNSAKVSAANVPGGPAIITDNSDSGADPSGVNAGEPGDTGSSDDPTPVTFESQSIGIAKDLAAVVEVSNNIFDVTFNYVVSNLSAAQVASNVQISEDFSVTFAAANSWEIRSVNTGGLSASTDYNGSDRSFLLSGADTLAVSASEQISVTVRVQTGGNNGPYSNQVVATTSNTVGGPATSRDLSDDGTNPDSNSDGDGSGADEQDPTVFMLPPQAIGLAKQMTAYRSTEDSRYEIDFEFVVANTSASEIATNVQITDDLAAAFPGVATLAVIGSPDVGGLTPAATAFDGIVNQSLLRGDDSLAVGQSETIRFTVLVDFAGSTGPFLNSANATVANSPGGSVISNDDSDDGTDPDGTNPSAPGDNGSSDDPTPVIIPEVNVFKTVSAAKQVSGPLWEATYTIVARNTGSITVSGISISDDVQRYLSPATVVDIPHISSNGFVGGAPSLTFNGAGKKALLVTGSSPDTALLSDLAEIPVGGEGRVEMKVRFDISTGIPDGANTAMLTSPDLNAPVPSDDPSTTPDDKKDKNPTKLIVVGDKDGDGVPDDKESDSNDRDGDGISDQQDYDPQGYFYCEDNGRILTGGSVAVRGPKGFASGVGESNGITIIHDGSEGFYQFYHDGTPGVYALELVYPPSGSVSTARLPQAEPFDAVSATDDPVILGSSEVADTAILADFSELTNSPFYTRFEMAAGASSIFSNNLPMTNCAGDGGSVVLGKISSSDSVAIGDFASYTLTLVNTEDYALTDVIVNDSLPPGFSFVEESGQLVRGGVVSPIATEGARPVAFTVGRIAAGEELQINYLLRAGVGLLPGIYTNTAQVMIRGVSGSNIASADIKVIEDALINKTRVIGKVWHDRDGDGWQDRANATGITLAGGPFSQASGNGITRLSQDIAGRLTQQDDLQNTTLKVLVNHEWRADDEVILRTKEGSVLYIQRDGSVRTDHEGLKKRGYTGQQLTVTVDLSSDDVAEHTLAIVNHGINEEGLAGVRLATVEGYVIETDEFGRYHIEDISNVKADIGSNYIVKLDVESLPEFSELSTENPRVERLTQSLMSDIDFGVKLPGRKPVDIDSSHNNVGSAPLIKQSIVPVEKQVPTNIVYFDSGSALVSEEQIDHIRQSYDAVKGKQNVRVRFTGHTDSQGLSQRAASKFTDNLGLSRARAGKVAAFVQAQLGLADEALLTDGKSFTEPAATNMTAEGMAKNRRVEIDLVYDEVSDDGAPAVQKVQSLMSLAPEPASYGVVQVVEDRAVNDPRLAITAETEAVAADTDKLQFHAYSNYPAFIERYELSVYAAKDVDRIAPLAVLVDKPENGYDVSASFTWQPQLLQAGESYNYVLRAIGKDGHTDQTAPHSIRVFDEDPIVREHASLRNLASIYGQTDLVRQSIAINGARIRVTGRGIDQRYAVMVEGQSMLVGPQGKFVLETHQREGDQIIAVEMIETNVESATQEFAKQEAVEQTGEPIEKLIATLAEAQAEGISNINAVEKQAAPKVMRRELATHVDGKYLFMVGMANVTVGGNDIKGSVEPLSGDERFDDSTYATGRVAFYVKGKIKGKYLVTAQMDTTEDVLHNMTDNLQRKDPTSIFRRLEPEQYYPVYGDDSTLRKDTDTQGALYVRVDWDKSRALWGNFGTDMTQNEFAQYNRSLYGAQLLLNSTEYTEHNDNRWHANVFVSEPQTASAHNEFLSTGGSLYYLSKTDVVQGSERLRVEVRRRDTLQVVENITLEPGKDYQFDYIQGRVILNKPLSMVATNRLDSIVKDRPLEGDDVYLLADFEYVPLGFDSEDLTVGGRGEAWLTDNIAVGVSHVDEARSGADYTLSGADITLKAGEGTYLKLEAATSDSIQSNSMESSNGGLQFTEQKVLGDEAKGDAFGVEARLNLAEVFHDEDGIVRAWYKQRDAGFSSSREVRSTVDTSDTGYEGDWQATSNLRVSSRGNVLDREGQLKHSSVSLQGDYTLTDKLEVGLEARHDEREFANAANDARALMVGARARYELNARDGVYLEAQTAADDAGSYADNDMLTVGWERQVNERLGFVVEVADGDRGSALIGGIDYQVNEKLGLDFKAGIGSNAYNRAGATLGFDNGYQLYGSYGNDPDQLLAGNGSRRITTIGQRKTFANGLQLYNEHQRSNGGFENGVTDVYGVDIGLSKAMRINVSLQQSELESNGSNITRDAATVAASYRTADLQWTSRLEFRKDETGSGDYEQWLTTNSAEHKVSDDWRWLAKLNYSITKNERTGDNAARFAEGSLGFAYRPAWDDRLNALARYTYLYDLVAPDQVINRPDQQSQVAEIEAIYDMSRRWEIGGKLAARVGKARYQRDSGQWFDNGVELGVVRARYHMVKQWDGMLEYRYLTSTEVDDVRQGWLMGMYRQMGSHFKMGVGYNFTDFSDDLTDLDYDYGGWFIDAVGKF